MSFEKIAKYGEFNSYDLLKVRAIVTMIRDHMGVFFFEEIRILRIIGRISFPLFAFCIGYNLKYKNDISLLCLTFITCISPQILGPKIDFLTRESFLKISILPSILIIRYFMDFFNKYITPNSIYVFLALLWFFSFASMKYFQYGTLGIIVAITGYCSAKQSFKAMANNILYGNLFMYFLVTALIFRTGIINSFILLIEFIFIGWLMSDFKIKPIKLPHLLERLALITSRYALIIYFIHSEIFKLIFVIS
jgi:hypothetical protein